MNETKLAAAEPKFLQGLGLLDSTMLVAGSMIGSGIFIVSADIGAPGRVSRLAADSVACHRRLYHQRRPELRRTWRP